MGKLSLFVLRVSLGWLMFYAGITKVLDSAWSAEGYLKMAKTFPALFQWFTQPGILPVVNFLNEWGLTILGASLILGLGIRISGVLGALLMLLYYFPVLDFPFPNPHSYIIDEHIIYMLVLLFLSAINAGDEWGLDGMLSRKK